MSRQVFIKKITHPTYGNFWGCFLKAEDQLYVLLKSWWTAYRYIKAEHRYYCARLDYIPTRSFTKWDTYVRTGYSFGWDQSVRNEEDAIPF